MNNFSPSLSASFNNSIWKVETDDKNTIVAIETRDLTNKSSFYSAFNYKNGECLFKEITVENSWFWGLDRIHDGFIFLHSYINEGSPEHKGIIAIDPLGNIKWQQFNITLENIAENGLLVYNPKIKPKKLELISFFDGSSIQWNNSFNFTDRAIILPDIIINKLLINHLLPDNVEEPIFYIRINNKEILAFHTKSENVFRQQLTVWQGETILHKDYLAQHIQKLNPEAFFIDRSYLFYIRNDKREFVSYLV